MDNPIDLKWKAELLDRYLKREYGYDLFDFAFSLAVTFIKTRPLIDLNIWRLRKPGITNLTTIQREIANLKKIRDGLIRKLEEHYRVLSTVRNPLFPTEIIPGIRLQKNLSDRALKSMITSVYRIRETITTEIDTLTGALSLFKISRGAPATPSILLGSLWSLIMRDKESIHLENIGNLFNWFYTKLENTSYGEKIKNTPALEDISRFMKYHRDLMLSDVKKIFVHSYKDGHSSEKGIPYSICFDVNEPRFIKKRSVIRNICDSLLFPQLEHEIKGRE